MESGRVKKFWKRNGFTIVTTLCLTLFTGYALLDTFVIPRSYAQAQLGEVEDVQGELRIVLKNNGGSNGAEVGNDSSISDDGSDGAISNGEAAEDSSSVGEGTRGEGSSTVGRNGSEEEMAGEKSLGNGRNQGVSGKTVGGEGRKSAGGRKAADNKNSAGSGYSAEGGNAEEGKNSAESGNSAKGVGSVESGTAKSYDTIKNSDSSYRDSHISIELLEYLVNNTTVYVADIQMDDAAYLKTALANDTYGKNVKADTSEIAAAHQAILAVNGDFYGARSAGYVIREGVLYRETGSGNEDLVIYRDGSFEIIREDEISAKELLEKGAWNVLSFGPALIEDGEISVSAGEEVGRAMASNPRTALGILEEGHYLMVVSDGRTQESEGLSLEELAQFLKALGAETAYNLDGGGSSTMIFQGNLINNPTTGGNRITERSVSDIVYIGY